MFRSLGIAAQLAAMLHHEPFFFVDAEVAGGVLEVDFHPPAGYSATLRHTRRFTVSEGGLTELR